MEIEPMRAIGVALDKATLQQTLYSLGIDRTFDSLTRAQKTELLYYQIMTQTSKMQGELGRTLATPSQALRIMKQEFTQLARAVGSVFIPILMKVIPVVRAVVQVLTSAAKSIANFFGFDISDYVLEVGNLDDSIGGISDGLDDVTDSATSAAKALNKMLMPFDELNNINFSTGGGASGGTSAGLGGTLLSELPEYNIFDSITGNVNAEVEKWKRKIEELMPVIKTVAGIMAGMWAVSKIAKFVEWIQRVDKALSALGKLGGLIKIGIGALLAISGIWTMWKGMKKILNGDLTIWNVLQTIGGGAVGTFGIVTILKGIANLGGWKLNFGNAITFSVGIILGIVSFETVLDGISKNDITKTLIGAVGLGFSVGTIIKSLGGGLKFSLPMALAVTFTTITVGIAKDAYEAAKKQDIGKVIGDIWESAGTGALTGAAIGSFIPIPGATAIGTGIGALTGGLSSYIAALNGAKDAQKDYFHILSLTSDELKNAKEKLTELTDQYDLKVKSIEDSRDATLLDMQVSEAYIKDLDSIVDSNGHVIEGNKERAKIILQELNKALGLELSLDDDLIIKNGDTGESYSKIRDNIDDVIKKKKEDAEQTAKIELYTEAYKQRILMSENLSKAATDYQNLLEEYRNADKEGLIKNQKQRKEWEKKLKESYANVEVSAEGYKNSVDTLASRSKQAFGKVTEEFNTTSQTIMNNTKSTVVTAESTVRNSSLPKDYKALAEMAKRRFNENFDINSVVTSKIQGASNTMYSNSYLVNNASSSLANIVKNNLNNIDTETSGKQSVWGFANGILSAISGTKFGNALGSLANSVVSGIKNKLGIHSPSTVMRDEVGKFIPLGVAEGINMEADSVSKSMQDLADKTRVDMQEFDFYTGGNLVSTISGRIQAQTSTALNENTLQNMANATYEGMARALIENNDDYNPQFNVYVGNDKIYSGYSNYKSNESNRYGVKV